ncbi:MAG TPA: cytochrome c biogenesis protein CcdA [Roseiflexaceae bacterium]|nr:cytochrome c biogenesis protein CcdA [Roseiflexaceae bacterium]
MATSDRDRPAAIHASTVHRRTHHGLLLLFGIVSVVITMLLVLPGNPAAELGYSSLLVLAPLAFISGMLSFLSPCCLPVLSAYFAYTFQSRRDQIVLTTLAFFLGIATTMVLLGATATALSQLLFDNLRILTIVGGLLIIGFGVMNLLGKGFGGMRLDEQPEASIAGSYLYGATFALGWTACVGPILGALLTMLATQGLAVLQGAILSFLYALGLGAPLMLIATFFSRLGPGSPVWRVLRGRGFMLNIGFTTLHLHTASLISGLLLITMGALLATGQLAVLSAMAVRSPLAGWVLDLETGLRSLVVERN